MKSQKAGNSDDGQETVEAESPNPGGGVWVGIKDGACESGDDCANEKAEEGLNGLGGAGPVRGG